MSLDATVGWRAAGAFNGAFFALIGRDAPVLTGFLYALGADVVAELALGTRALTVADDAGRGVAFLRIGAALRKTFNALDGALTNRGSTGAVL